MLEGFVLLFSYIIYQNLLRSTTDQKLRLDKEQKL